MLSSDTKPVCAADPSPGDSPFSELLKAIEHECWYTMTSEQWEAMGLGRDLYP